MDDIYKAAVRDWGGWAYWGLTYLRMGDKVTPGKWWGPRRGPSHFQARASRGLWVWCFQGMKRVRDSGTGEELSKWMEEEVSPFSIMSAPVPKCLWSESLSLSHFYLHLSL